MGDGDGMTWELAGADVVDEGAKDGWDVMVGNVESRVVLDELEPVWVGPVPPRLPLAGRHKMQIGRDVIRVDGE